MEEADGEEADGEEADGEEADGISSEIWHGAVLRVGDVAFCGAGSGF